jgi:hypothetical protein
MLKMSKNYIDVQCENKKMPQKGHLNDLSYRYFLN